MPGQSSFHTHRQDRSVKNAEWGKQRHTPPLPRAFPTVLSDMPHGPAKRLRIKPPSGHASHAFSGSRFFKAFRRHR